MTNIKVVFLNIFRCNFKSLLTIFSICIGTASVILISNIGTSAKGYINDELTSMGLGSVIVYTNKSVTSSEVTSDDIISFENNNFISKIAPVNLNYGSASNGYTSCDAVLFGIDSSYDSIFAMDLLYGNKISDFSVETEQNVCIVSAEYAVSLYGRENILGKEILITISGNQERFTVIGIYSDTSNLVQNMVSQYVPTLIYIPNTVSQRMASEDGYTQVVLKLNISDEQAGSITDAEILENISDKTADDYYSIENLSSQLTQFNAILDLITMILSGIAGISLVVAGIGVTTIMLVTVSERTREIGIKKSIGATKIKLIFEFLLESVTITLVGNFIGLILGTIITVVGGLAFSIPVELNINMYLLSWGISAATGGIFGIYPAVLAANMNPVEAFRQG